MRVPSPSSWPISSAFSDIFLGRSGAPSIQKVYQSLEPTGTASTLIETYKGHFVSRITKWIVPSIHNPLSILDPRSRFFSEEKHRSAITNCKKLCSSAEFFAFVTPRGPRITAYQSLQDLYTLRIFCRFAPNYARKVLRFPVARRPTSCFGVTNMKNTTQSGVFHICDPTGNRTPIYAVKGRCPNR